MQKTAIVVPCYNEEKRMKADEFQNFARRYPNVTFLFVNDCSTDNTMQLINDICKSNPNQMLNMSLESNKGKAEAVRMGFLNAIDMTSKSFKNIGYWDADLATPLDAITKMTKHLESPEILMVFGARVKLLNHRIKRKAVRHYLGRIYATFASLVLNLQIYDTQCGAKILKKISELKTVFNRSFSMT
jgi:glycosyltransferase involved in cell wall biosynthesis